MDARTAGQRSVVPYLSGSRAGDVDQKRAGPSSNKDKHESRQRLRDMTTDLQ